MSKQKQKKASKAEEKTYKELWAILCMALAVFIFFAETAPQSTGVVGYWMVDYFLKSLFGEALILLPVSLSLTACSLWIQKSKSYHFSIFGTLVPFIIATIYIELKLQGIPQALLFPISTNGGGLIGVVGAYALVTPFGLYGATIILLAGLILSLAMCCNISLGFIGRSVRWTCEQIVLQFSPKRKQRKTKTSIKTMSGLVKELFFTLFYKKVTKPSYADRQVKDALRNLKEVKSSLKSENKKPKDDPKPVFLAPQIEMSSEDIDLGFEPEEEIEEVVDDVVSEDMPKMTSSSESFDSYKLPHFKLLTKPTKGSRHSKAAIKEAQDKAAILEETFASFKIEMRVVNITPGPSVTRYELQPAQGVKVSKIMNLAQDLALSLAAPDVRIEAPIPGKALIGIEVPNINVDIVYLKSLIDKTDFLGNTMALPCAMGLTITGDAVMMPLEKMPHVLIAGSTGSGKSVCINAIIISILMRARPDEVKFLMIDPKKVELSLYEGIPHLVAPVVTNPQKAAATLKQWALVEMERRYEEFARVGVKDIQGYNKFVDEETNPDLDHRNEEGDIEVSKLEKIPFLVVIIDELADLMMVASQEVENTICRLAQMARATGIHLVIATQRPSVNVVTGLIKANVPSRISFAVQSQIDSRTILDTVGAEKLLGRGDMLYLPVGQLKPTRVQGVFIPEDEVKRVVSFVKSQAKPSYDQAVLEIEELEPDTTSNSSGRDDLDELFDEAKQIVLSTKYASTSYLQRKLRIGYNRAARIMDQLEEEQVIGAYDSESKSRTVLQ